MAGRFQKYNGFIRKIGRTVVLPDKKIKTVIKESIFDRYPVDTVYDFGAGTLYWSDWFLMRAEKVYAIDMIYKNDEDKSSGIIKLHDMHDIKLRGENGGVLWLCDVLHHLSLDFSIQVLDYFSKDCQHVLIKDIDCRHKVGNMANRLHDKIINGEDVRNINPEFYAAKLKEQGYAVRYNYLPKLWYPHFLLIGVKKLHD